MRKKIKNGYASTNFSPPLLIKVYLAIDKVSLSHIFRLITYLNIDKKLSNKPDLESAKRIVIVIRYISFP